MNSRDRLIELLEQAKIKAQDTIGSMNNGFGAWYADYLLEHGVIATPCKVGDTVYVNPYTWGYLSFSDYEHSTYFVVAEVVSIIKTRKQNLIKLKIYNRTTHTAKYHRYPISSIGITVFLTREEAEKALERSKDNE